MIDLTKSRESIDRIDKQIVDLFEERMKVAGDVAEYKGTQEKRFLTRREKHKSWKHWEQWLLLNSITGQ